MTTRGLDVLTILHAFSALNRELKTTGWNAKNPQQQKIFAWLEEHRELLAKVTGLEAKASRFWQDLNTFLTDHKFDPMVEPFDPEMGIGVVSILDKLVSWRTGPGAKVQIETEQGERPGFELPLQGVNIYAVDGYPGSYLLELLTKSDDTLWLFVYDDTSLGGLDMVELSMDVMSSSRRKNPAFAGVQVPMVDFDIKPDISWLLGADTKTEDGIFYYVLRPLSSSKCAWMKPARGSR